MLPPLSQALNMPFYLRCIIAFLLFVTGILVGSGYIDLEAVKEYLQGRG